MPEPITIKPGRTCDIARIDLTERDPKYDKKSARRRIKQNARRMAELANVMFAENRRSILLVLQGMDTAGKDGTIRTVMRGVNPRGCQVYSFKQPSEEELDHDFLWRVHQIVPRKGNIGIFNRSHYEDVLVVRVHNLVPESVWKQRYEQINQFEKLLAESGTTIIKCFLLISKETQRKRLQARIDNPDDHWKFNPGDLAEHNCGKSTSRLIRTRSAGAIPNGPRGTSCRRRKNGIAISSLANCCGSGSKNSIHNTPSGKRVIRTS